MHTYVTVYIKYYDLITSPASRSWSWSYKFASLDFFCFLFFSVSKVGLPLMGDTAGTKLREPIETQRLTAEYINKTCICCHSERALSERASIKRASKAAY